MSLKRLREIHEAGEPGPWEAIENSGSPGTYALHSNGQDTIIDVPGEHTAKAIVSAMNSNAALLDLADAVEELMYLNAVFDQEMNTDTVKEKLAAVIKISERME